jgi:hypothetical protein
MDDANGMNNESEAIATGANYARDHAGRFTKGSRGGPGRTPVRALRRIMEGARLLTKSQAISGLQVMSTGAPAAAARCVQIASRSRNEMAALKAAELVLAYAHGLPVQKALIAATSLDSASSPEERRERMQRLFERVRQVCGPAALPVIDQPRGDHAQEMALDGDGG